MDAKIRKHIAETLRIDPERIIWDGDVYYVPNVKLEDFRKLQLPIGIACVMGHFDGDGNPY